MEDLETEWSGVMFALNIILARLEPHDVDGAITSSDELEDNVEEVGTNLATASIQHSRAYNVAATSYGIPTDREDFSEY